MQTMLSIPKERVPGDTPLPNNRDTWARISKKDHFAELGFSSTLEKESFLKSWIENNPYSSI